MAINLDDGDRPPPRPQVPRDRFGRPVVPPRAGGPARAWTRATTIAETLDDRWALEQWKMRQVLIGACLREDLVQLAAVTDHEDRNALNGIVDQLLDAAQSNARANVGTAVHAAVEHWARTGEIIDKFSVDVEAVAAALNQAGATVDRDHVEQFVVNETVEAAGTFDLRVSIDGRWHIADLKTGSSVEWAQRAFAVQLAVYAGHTSTWDPMSGEHGDPLDVDQHRGIIIHCPAGSGNARLWWVDLEAGREALEHALWVRRWRGRRNLLTEIASGGPDTATGARSGTVGTPDRTKQPGRPTRITPTVQPPAPLPGDGEPAPVGAHQAWKTAAVSAPEAVQHTIVRWRNQAKGRLRWSLLEGRADRRRVAINRAALSLAGCIHDMLGERCQHPDEHVDAAAATILEPHLEDGQMADTIGETLALLTPEQCAAIHRETSL